MNPDDFKEAWRRQTSQTRLLIDAELLLKEVRRNQRWFTATIFWRDVREVGTSLLMVPLWLYLGVKHSLPWTWYLTVPALLWVATYMLADRMRHKRQPTGPGEPLRQRVESSLAQIEHQIWPLRNVLWWYLLPLAFSMLAFIGQAAWQERAGGWWTAIAISLVVTLVVIVFAGVYWLNQYTVRAELEPRRRELEALLMSLEDETPDAG
jgi:thiosulfate reductase cytochrome b subunit